MAIKILDMEGIGILAELLNEEMDLYEGEDVMTIAEASLILFSHSLIIGSINLLKK